MLRHALAPMFEPGSLVIVADRPPAAGSLSPALKARCTVVDCAVGEAPELPASLNGLAPGERPDLALVCVSPAVLPETLRRLAALSPRSVILLPHELPDPYPRGTLALCRAWAEENRCELLGPRSFGAQRPHAGLNLSQHPVLARPPGGPAGPVALHHGGGHGLGRGRAHRLFRRRLAGRRGRGRPVQGAGLPGQRPAHRQHRALSGGRRAGARVHERAARRRQREAGHRAQGRPARRRQQRCCVRRRAAARRRGAGALLRAAVLGGQGAGLYPAAEGAARGADLQRQRTAAAGPGPDRPRRRRAQGRADARDTAGAGGHAGAGRGHRQSRHHLCAADARAHPRDPRRRAGRCRRGRRAGAAGAGRAGRHAGRGARAGSGRAQGQEARGDLFHGRRRHAAAAAHAGRCRHFGVSHARIRR